MEKLEELIPTHDIKAIKWQDKSRRHLQKKQWDEAIRAASIALTLDPGLEKAYCNRSHAYLEKRLFQQSYDDSLTALYINPRNAFAHYLQGLTLERLGRKQQALKSLEKSCGLGEKRACKAHKRLYYK